MSHYTVGSYLAKRLEQVGLKHYFMVPGDYNLVLLDELLTNDSMTQVGCCNELNAAYAAEAYARVNGSSAVVTTFNVGAFSALNGVAGAYAERLPVIFVSSGYNTNDPGANHLLHHTIGTHDFAYQYKMFGHVTCAAVRIVHPENAPELIDHAISAALRERKPAYIEIACNLSDAPCPDPSPFETLAVRQASNSAALAAAVERASVALNSAQKPILLAGTHLRSFDAVDAFRDLAEALGCGVAVMPNAKGFFPETHPLYVGMYFGGVSSPGCEAIVDWADLILAAGPLFTDYTTVGWTALPAKERLISTEPLTVRLADAEFTGVALRDFLAELAKNVRRNDTTVQEFQRIVPATELGPSANSLSADVENATPLTRRELWAQIGEQIDSKTTMLVETGDSWLNGLDARLPEGARFEIEMQWGSIGLGHPGHLRLRHGARTGPPARLRRRRRLLPADRPGSGQHDPTRPGDPLLPLKQPRVCRRVGDPRRPLQLHQELGLRSAHRRLERRGRPWAWAHGDHRRRAPGGDRGRAEPPRRTCLHRMPDCPRRLPPEPHQVGVRRCSRQYLPARLRLS